MEPYLTRIQGNFFFRYDPRAVHAMRTRRDYKLTSLGASQGTSTLYIEHDMNRYVLLAGAYNPYGLLLLVISLV